MTTKPRLAIDIGASGGRHILGRLEDGAIKLEEIYRFPNGMVSKGGCLCWEVDRIFGEIINGMKKCALAGSVPASVGIDTWGVDFVLLDRGGARLGPAVAYRDSRTEGMDAAVDGRISEAELYSRTGIQKQIFNTIYQLMALKERSPRALCDATYLLTMPDYLHYRLCGVMKTEYTHASTSGLLGALSGTWDDEVIRRCGFPRRLFGEVVPAGTVLGGFTPEARQAAGFDCKVILPPSHDTASAFLAVPARTENAVYISSGTWSLMGVELASPILTEESRLANFTNEGGYGRRYRYLKNIMGLWMLQSVQKELGGGMGYAEMVALARDSDCGSIVNVNDDRFFAPKSMIGAIEAVCRENGEALPQGPGDLTRCICDSLAVSYARTMKDLAGLTGRRFDGINIIGGGSANAYLNEATAAACGVPVYAGPSEGTALGNILSQMITCGEIPDLAAAREIVRRSFEIVKTEKGYV